jgi:hypothetical protein
VDVLAEGSLILPDSQINVNSVDSGDVVSVKTIDVNLEDSLGDPVTPTSVGLVGNTLTIEVPSGASPSGVLFKTIEPSQYTSYRTGDEGWRVQNGWFDYTPPTTPKTIAELDFTSANFFSVLKNPLVVNGVSSTTRFVDINGVQVFSATGNANTAVIDKLTGLMYNKANTSNTEWASAIDAALAYSIVINGVTYNDWYLATSLEILNTVHNYAGISVYNDPLTGVSLWSTQPRFWSSTTYADATTSAWAYEVSTRGLGSLGKVNNFRNSYFITNVRNLITAP